MALSRIWTAFILIALGMATYQFIWVEGQQDVFARLVTGKADDSYATYFHPRSDWDSAARSQFLSKAKAVGYKPVESPAEATILVIQPNEAGADSMQKAFPQSTIYAYSALQHRLRKPVDGIIETTKVAVNICIGLIGIMALFMGFMGIAEKAGGIGFLARVIGPFFSRIFPDVPKGHPSMGHMVMNFSANLLGLDNAATPFGIKAMESLQELNPEPTRASNAQVMFLCLHASGLTLIPVSIIALRAGAKAANPTDIFIPCMIATFAATLAALVIVAAKQRIRLFQPVILAWVGGLSATIALLVVYLKSLTNTEMQSFSGVLSNGLILFIFMAIIAGGMYKKIDVFSAFIEGAKGGFDTAVRIIPYLVGMLVAISLLRNAGVFDIVMTGMKQGIAWLGMDTRFVDGLPTALIKPFSGGGARGMMVDTMKTFGADSFAGRLSCILQGSSDTTFYVVAVYFGAVGIRNTRYAIGSMLLADLVGIITSIALAYLFFGMAV